MRLTNHELFKAVRYALYAGASAAVGLSAAPVFAQNAQGTDQSSQQLETITVTGSNIRRVDIETSNPVITIDAAQIQQSGKLTVGDLLQQMPAMSGSPVGPTTNNGGTYAGTQALALRGLGSGRTLVLVNGARYLNGDPNAIPANMIERIEVLTDGASAVYGSDAIAGVINFILKSNYQGAEFDANYGISDKDDGQRQGYSFTFGQSSDKGSIMAGVNYNKTAPVMAANRAFGKQAFDLTGSPTTPPYVFVGGSSNPKPGRVDIGGTPWQDIFGCTRLSINPGATGQTVDTNNWHCFGTADRFNYAELNYIQMPQERSSVFVNGVYHLTSNVDAYLTAWHSKTSATSQLAPSIIGTTPPGGLVISADSYYNPFGYELSFANGYNYQLRNVAGGNRVTHAGNSSDQIMTGLKGQFDIGNQNWTWNLGYNFGHSSLVATKLNLPNVATLNKDLGPSFFDPDTGTVVCGTPDAPILTGCTPFNIFDVNNGIDPNAVAALAAASAPATNTFLSLERVEHFDVSGGIIDLPAGTMSLAAGYSKRDEYIRNTVDSLLNIDPATGTCVLGTQCAAGLNGGYDVKEAYAELFVPILKDLPFIHALNLTVGDRWSKYSTFGSTNNWKAALEFRPIEDLLLRGTVSKVFRAPSISSIFGPPGASAISFGHDPCDWAGAGANPNAGNPACTNVPATGPFTNSYVADNLQFGAISSGSAYAGFPLGPEYGKSFDFGVVYDPHWLDGLSVSADVWRIYLLNSINSINGQSILDFCFNGATQFCPLFTRVASGPNQGQLATMIQPTVNLGRTDASGVDFNLTYRLPEFSFGRFTATVGATYMKYLNVDIAPGQVGDVVYHIAGHFVGYDSAAGAACPAASGACTVPRWKALSALNWNLGSWDASWRMRYIGRVQNGNPNLDEGQQAYPSWPGSVLKRGAYVYNDLTVGYTIEPINTRISVGVDNIADKQPPFWGYDTQTLNLGTDPATYDVVGRYFHAGVEVKF